MIKIPLCYPIRMEWGLCPRKRPDVASAESVAASFTIENQSSSDVVNVLAIMKCARNYQIHSRRVIKEEIREEIFHHFRAEGRIL